MNEGFFFINNSFFFKKKFSLIVLMFSIKNGCCVCKAEYRKSSRKTDLQSVTFILQLTCDKTLNTISAANVVRYFDGLIRILLKPF